METISLMTFRSAGRLSDHYLQAKSRRTKAARNKALVSLHSLKNQVLRKSEANLCEQPDKGQELRTLPDALHGVTTDETEKVLDRLSPLLYARIKSTDVDDVQLFANFFQKYVGDNPHGFVQSSYLWALTGFTPTTPLLKCARRTVGLTDIAAVSQDVRLVRESRISYSRLLGLLQFSLAFPSKTPNASQIRELIAGIALLTNLNDPSGNAGLGGEEWVTHFRGVEQLVSKHGRYCLRAGNPLDAGLARHAMLNGFQLAVAQRKRWDADTTWLRGMSSNPWVASVRQLYRLPGLLEMTDQMLSGDSNAMQLGEVVLQLGEMRERAIESFPDVHRLSNIDTASPQFLSAAVEEHCVMSDSKTFPTLFAPMVEDSGAPSKAAYAFVFATLYALISECTILRIWHFHPTASTGISSEARSIVEQSTYLLAKRLCKGILSFTQADKLAYVSVVRLCLTLARNVFEQQEAFSDMGWCDACLIANQMRMQRLRRVCPPTLCKVDDVLPGLAEVGRYKQRFNRQAFVVGRMQGSVPKQLQ